jgi:RNA polymerase primary sigma factor
LTRTKQLRLLIVEDTGTTGLLGPEFGEGNFAALCRNNLDSNKKSGTAGGAFGLGKAVLWRVSQFSLVLFNSNLHEPDKDGNQLNRVFGRCDLPWHSCDGEEYAGPGWLGRIEKGAKEGDRTVSYWGNDVLASDLYLGRATLGSGTSIAVVGFHDPSDECEDDADSLASAIESAVADCFWPDLTAGNLEAKVEIYDGPIRRSGRDVSAPRWRQEYVDALQKHERGDLVDELDKPGDVVARRVELHIPQRTEDPTHPAATHEAILLVRRAPDDAHPDHLNELALFRGVGMVVQYLSLRGICLGAVPCHAMLLCGEAAGATPECKMADRFLRTSEPPAHERWTSTPDLKAEYARGGLAAIQAFIEAAKTAIREIVRPTDKDLSDGPNALKELLAVGEAPKPSGPKIARPVGTVDDDGSWVIDSRIRVKRSSDEWEVEPAVVFQQETGGGQAVRWKDLQATSNCELIQPGVLLIPANVNEARFTGRTDPSSHLIDARECTISVELKRIHRRPGEEK